MFHANIDYLGRTIFRKLKHIVNDNVFDLIEDPLDVVVFLAQPNGNLKVHMVGVRKPDCHAAALVVLTNFGISRSCRKELFKVRRHTWWIAFLPPYLLDIGVVNPLDGGQLFLLLVGLL